MTESDVNRVILIDRLISVRQAVDDALRVLSEETGGTPPPPDSIPQPAEPSPAFGGSPVGCKHEWVLSGFGSSGKTCCKCGARGEQ